MLIAGLVAANWCAAQWDVPVPIILDGPDTASRQVTGLADPVAVDAAMSVDAVRSSVVSYAAASGTAALTADLFPAPAAYSVGMVVNIVPTQANARAASLELNGLGPVPIVKWGALPLDSADLTPGTPARMVYDGTRFLLLNSVPRPCPVGYFPANRAFCIADSATLGATFFLADLGCAARIARLCSLNEWAFACQGRPGFLASVSALEWIDSAGNNVNGARALGTGYMDAPAQPTGNFSCTYGDSVATNVLLNYRCCMNR